MSFGQDKLILVRLDPSTQEMVEEEVAADRFEIEDGAVLHYWQQGGAGGTYGHQWVPIQHLQSWRREDR